MRPATHTQQNLTQVPPPGRNRGLIYKYFEGAWRERHGGRTCLILLLSFSGCKRLKRQIPQILSLMSKRTERSSSSSSTDSAVYQEAKLRKVEILEMTTERDELTMEKIHSALELL